MPLRFIARICLVAAIFLISVAGRAQQSGSDSDEAIAQKLKATERAWLNAEKSGDATAFEKIAANDWTAINPEGKIQSKAERAAEIKAAHPDDATMGEMRVRIFGETAVVMGSDDETTVEGGKKSVSHYVWTDVFVKRNGKWLAVASQTAETR